MTDTSAKDFYEKLKRYKDDTALNLLNAKTDMGATCVEKIVTFGNALKGMNFTISFKLEDNKEED